MKRHSKPRREFSKIIVCTVGAVTIFVTAFTCVMVWRTTYAAPLVHTQGADTITETTGENTEQVQRRQDSDIEAIKEQLNTGFTGTTVTHTFAPAQLSYWKGYDGTGVPEGILDQTRNRLYL